MTQKRTITLFAIVAVVVCLALAAWAQGGPGKGCGAGGCKVSQTCPMGGQQKCCLQGGWWTNAQPKTPAQKALVAEVTRLHEQARAKMLELAALQAANAPQEQIATAQSELKALCAGMCDLMKQKQALCKQMGAPDCGNCKGCASGCAMSCGMGDWWNRVQPKTDAEKAFVADVKGFRGQILAAQAAGDVAKANALRGTLLDMMHKEQVLHQQVMMSMDRSAAPGPGRGCGMGNGQGKRQGCCPQPK